jgi:hypothetical protein
MSIAPIDYKTYDNILTRAEIRKDACKLPTLEAALRSLVADEPTAAHVQAYRRYTGVRAVLKQAPARVAAPAVPQAPPPPPTAREVVVAEIAKRQAAQPSLSAAEAWSQTMGADEALYARYVLEMRHPQPPAPPVAKAEPPTYAQIVAVAKAQAASRPDMTTEQALTDLALAHPDEGAYWEAHRRFHLSSAGRQEHTARQAAGRQEP